jgi:TonB family protein
LFTAIQTGRKRARTPAAALSITAHLLFVLALLLRPLNATFVRPSDIRFGRGAVVTELVYAAPLELQNHSLPDRRVYRKPVAHKIGKTQPANPVTDPLQAGSPQGSLPDGPIVGFVREPALPIVGPDVPRSSLPAGIQGDVIVEITIDTQGNVAATRVLQSLGPEVDEKVVATLFTWHFRPATTDGVANVSKQDVHFHFPS